jgi:hypothetical protein
MMVPAMQYVTLHRHRAGVARERRGHGEDQPAERNSQGQEAKLKAPHLNGSLLGGD